MKQAIFLTLCIVGLLIVFQCSTPTNPYTDPNNTEISLLGGPSGVPFIGDAVAFSLAVFLPKLIEKIDIAATSGWDTSIVFSAPFETYDTIPITYILPWAYNDTLTATAYPRGAQARTATLMIAAQGFGASVKTNLKPLYERTQGESCTLSVSASGTEPITYTWIRDGDTVQMSQSNSFILDPAAPADSGTYHCIVSNPWGADSSQYAFVRIIPLGAPSAPEGFGVTMRTESFVEFRWNTVEGAEKYRVYRDTVDNSSPAAYRELHDTIFVDTDPGDYFYWVTTVRGGLESFRSSIVYTGAENHAPVWSADSLTYTLGEAESLTIDLFQLCSDQDAGDTLEFSILGMDGRAHIENAGMLVIKAVAGDSGNIAGHLIATDGVLNDTVQLTAAVTPRYFALTVAAENGSVLRDPELPQYRLGDTVTVTANPAAGYVFREWRGDILGTAVSRQIVLDSDKQVEAVFWPEAASQCIAVNAGESLNEMILQQSAAANRPSVLCPQAGKYDNNTIEIQGTVEIILE